MPEHGRIRQQQQHSALVVAHVAALVLANHRRDYPLKGQSRLAARSKFPI
jgi:hypothetical protein